MIDFVICNTFLLLFFYISFTSISQYHWIHIETQQREGEEETRKGDLFISRSLFHMGCSQSTETSILKLLAPHKLHRYTLKELAGTSLGGGILLDQVSIPGIYLCDEGGEGWLTKDELLALLRALRQDVKGLQQVSRISVLHRESARRNFHARLVHDFHECEEEPSRFKQWLFEATDVSQTGEVFADELACLLLVLTRDGVLPESFLAHPAAWDQDQPTNRSQSSSQVARALVREFSLTSDRDTLDEVEFDNLAEMVVNELVVSRRIGCHGIREAGGFELLRTIGLGAESVVKLGYKGGGCSAILISPRIPSVVLRQMREDTIQEHLVGVEGVVQTLGRFGDESFLFTQKELCICSLEFALTQCGPYFSEDICRHILRTTLETMALLHHHRIAHRDISADNILIGKTGVIKLTDFGISEFLPRGFKPKLHHKRAPPVYARYPGNRYTIPPECITGKEADPYAIDIFECGVLLFRMLTGHYPFPEVLHFDGSDVKARCMSLDLSMYSKALRRFLRSLLNPDPKQRPTAEEALEDPWLKDKHDIPLIPLTKVIVPLTHKLSRLKGKPISSTAQLYKSSAFSVKVSIRKSKEEETTRMITLHTGYIWDFRAFIKSLLT